MTRKLASIQRISKIEPIAGANTIERATILGWTTCIKKGEFKKGDLCVFGEIDSIMPDIAPFKFLAKHKFRIKTIRFCGQISQGCCFPA